MGKRKKPSDPVASEKRDELLPAVDPVADLYDIGVLLSGAIPIPLVNTAISHVLSGWSRERQWERVREVVHAFNDALVATQQSIREDYARSDEFEDLLDETLRRVARERHEDKRRLYVVFLAAAVTGPGTPYDEVIRFIRTLEDLHLAPSNHPRHVGGSSEADWHGRRWLDQADSTTTASQFLRRETQ